MKFDSMVKYETQALIADASEFDPYFCEVATTPHFIEAVTELPHDAVVAISKAFASARYTGATDSAAIAGKLLAIHIEAYWESLAKVKAIAKVQRQGGYDEE